MEQHASSLTILEATQYGGGVGDALGAIEGEGRRVDEFTVLPAPDGGRKITLILPPGPQLPWSKTPAEALGAARHVEGVRGIEDSARHHLRLVLNVHHDQAAFLQYIVTQIGGSFTVEKGEAKLRLTADVAAIERVIAFLHAMPGLGSHVRVNPVYESLASRPEVDDLAGAPESGGRGQRGEEVVLRITGDSRGNPQLGVIRQLEAERGVDVFQLSCHPRPPRSTSFEMVAVLRMRDPSKLAALQGALVSSHMGVCGAERMAPDKLRQNMQVVTDADGRRDLANASGGALQARYKRWGDPRLVVSGSMKPRSVARIVTDVAAARVPYTTDVPVPLVARPGQPVRKIQHGFGAFGGMPETAEPGASAWDIQEGMRRYLLELLGR